MNRSHTWLGRLAVVVSVVLAVGFVTVPAAAGSVTSTRTTMSGDASSVEFGQRLTLTGTVTAGGSGLVNQPVLIESRPVGGTWRDWSTVATVRTNTEGQYVRSWTPGASREYRGRIVGTSSYGSSFSNSVRVTVTRPAPAATRVSASVSSGSVSFGSRVTLSGTVTSGGTGLANRSVIIESRPVGGTWRDWSTVTTVRTNAEGQYTRSWTPGASREYRGRITATSTHASSFSNAVTIRVTGKPSSGPTPTSISLSALGAPFRSGEAVWFTGRLSGDGRGIYGKVITIERRSVGGSTWTPVVSARTDGNGYFTAPYRPPATYEYRGRVSGSSNWAASTSPVVRASSSSGNRTLAQRADVLAAGLGSPSGSAETFTRGSSTITYQRYSRALLVEVRSGSTTRTWAVRGSILSKYLDMGGPRGDLGPPVFDAKCVLLESGCVQRFAGGTIYDNPNVAATATSVTGRQGELIATALSQVGYSTSVRNGSKYNRWVGTSNAWCSIFLSWVSEASGNKNLLPTRGNFPAFHSAMLTRDRVGARVGAIAFFDTHNDGITRATHAGLVIEVRGSTIITIEGNTSNPSTGSCCGVYIKQRSASHPMYYYMPDY